MPEVKIKKEWYCWLDDTGSEMLTLSPALLGGFFWCLGLVVNILIWNSRVSDWMVLLHGFIMIVVYMLIWSAIFMRRREVKE